MTIEEAYLQVVEYAQHLEKIVVENTAIDDDTLKVIRNTYIKPVTNVAQEWLGE